MAKIGYRTCQPIMDCGTGKWGNIKTTALTIFVDQSYAGNDSDGSQAKPYKYINPVVQKAPSGAHIAVATGTYLEDLNINSPMTIEGVWPQRVTINGQSNDDYGTVDVFTTGVKIQGVTITGTRMGIVVLGPGASVELVRVAVVGCHNIGVFLKKAQMTVRDSLVSDNRIVGIYLLASKSYIDHTVIRDTRERLSDQNKGEGIVASAYGDIGSTLEATDCLLDGNRTIGIAIYGSTAKIIRTMVRNTRVRANDQILGDGITASWASTSRLTSSLTISDSVVAHNHSTGIALQSSTGTVQRTVVRGTKTDGSKQTGRGIDAIRFNALDPTSNLTVIDSLVRDNQDAGIFFLNSKGTVNHTVVSDTKPTLEPIGSATNMSKAGYGLFITADSGTKNGSNVILSDSLVSGNHTIGVLFNASTGAIKRSIVTGTKPDVHDNKRGTGVSIEADETSRIQSTVAVSDSLVERNYSQGIRVLSSITTVDRSIVRDTRPEAASQSYGAGIQASAQLDVAMPARLTASDCIVSGNRFGGVGIADSTATLQRLVRQIVSPDRVAPEVS